MQPVNSAQYQPLLNLHSAETIGEREHDGDSDDRVASGMKQQTSSVFQFQKGMGTKINIMA